MYTDVSKKLVTQISEEDENYINAGADDEDKRFRFMLITHALHLNGAFDSATPGVGVSYIDKQNYFQLVPDIDSKLLTETEANNLKAIPAAIRELVEKARNWEALGKGKGGFAGSCVRFALRKLVNPNRETTVIKVITKEDLALAKEFAEYSNIHSVFGGVWFKNAWNVLALSASNFVRECHHWNSQNTRPIKALLGSLSQENEIPEIEYRKLFYLAIHPIPLEAFAQVYVIARDAKSILLSETVKTRLNVAPAGYADFCACAIAGEAFLKEDYASRAKISVDIYKLVNIAKMIKDNPLPFHPFASQMGIDHRSIEKGAFTEAMIVLSAYIKACIGGTLASSPALTKFVESHLRRVNILSKSFKDYNDRKSEDLMQILLGSEEIDINNVIEKIQPVVKVVSRLRAMADTQAPDDPMKIAADELQKKVIKVIGSMDTKVGEEILFDKIDLTAFGLYGPAVIVAPVEPPHE